MTPPIVEILPNKTALVQRALHLVIDQIRRSVDRQGFCTLALAGGGTPKPLYAALAEESLPWQNLYVFWGDERYVPPDHPDSNAGMARQVWLDRVPIPASQIFLTPTQATPPSLAAQTYEASLRDLFSRLQPDSRDAIPQFDLVLLGMGDDGHTASLFPHTAALTVSDRLVTVGYRGEDPRITFTLPLINHSRQVMFLAAGASKQAALQQVFRADGDDLAYPSRLVRPLGDLYWLLDEEATTGVNLP
ncbi:MAG: 6-phosphogluconolactonase [Nodosilinea sp. LVE1205-7]